MNSSTPQHDHQDETHRLRLVIRGAVQGVGFRPYIYRLAGELKLRGYVTNTAQGVVIDIEQEQQTLDQFLARLPRELPPRAFIQSCEVSYLDPLGQKSFEIRTSSDGGSRTAYVLPDIATCPDCLQDIFDSTNRRYLYQFTNCTNCGPRFTIIESLPYDRANTTMKKFAMCPSCREEYENPRDRRFHAQPNACPDCGPQLELWDEDGSVLAHRNDALLATAEAIKAGMVVAVKGLGGFHLIVDARNEQAVVTLRKRKRRTSKPLALMYPTLQQVLDDCFADDTEQRSLTSIESPIVLLRRRQDVSRIAAAVAPGNPYLGAMLPYTPLHHLLMRELGFPIVATSANLAEEPICFDEQEALRRLHGIADLYLVHDRPIRRHVDDSIVRIVAGREQVTRRARGYAPLPVTLAQSLPQSVAVGAHLKNSVAVSVGCDVFISQHIGDLETAEAYRAFENVLDDLTRLYEIVPEVVACDLHPDYLSTKRAREFNTPVVSIQHHYAHILSCMAENEVAPPVLGISWDGTGLGADGTIWGGEFLLVDETSYSRIGHLRQFPLAGGDAAVREPRRSALGLLCQAYGEKCFDMQSLIGDVFTSNELTVLRGMLVNKVNTIPTSSAGRLFDAVASLLGLCHKATYEGEAAMALEFAIGGTETEEVYPFEIGTSDSILILDWQPSIALLLADRDRGIPTSTIAGRFHNTLVEMIVAVAKRSEQPKVALSGGCFQNKYLTERTIVRLRAEGFHPYWHQRVPPNDGGIALGQIVAAARAGIGK
ncbi:MAG: carbamoyltransferase HypF [candidate division Zixibacteria bacterium]|nr:carbamoyltransferase HypF [candidate division Zixibacteria bacterium]